MKNKAFKVTNMTCASCSENISKTINKLSGISVCNVNLSNKRVDVSYDENIISIENITKSITSIGYEVSMINNDKITIDDFDNEKEVNKYKNKLILSSVFTIPLFIISMLPMVLHALNISVPTFIDIKHNFLIISIIELILVLPVIIVNVNYYIGGVKMLIKGHPNMNSLISIGTITSFIYSLYIMIDNIIYNMHNDLYFESVAVILTLITLGKYLEEISIGKTSNSIKKLIDLSPKEATILDGDIEKTVLVDEILVGDKIIVKPGEKFSVDGIILNGETSVDESMLTGESIPRSKYVSDNVIGGSINITGNVIYEATKDIENSSLFEIVKLVSNAQKKKAKISKLADRVSMYFVPAVIILALISAVLWYISGQSFDFSLKIFVSVLIIACPCALGLATPTAIMVSTGIGALNGILIKNGEALEVLYDVDTVVFDKTGTITKGIPEVTDIRVYSDITETRLLELAASLEHKSEHPLSKAITKKATDLNITINKDTTFTSVIGNGIKGIVDNIDVLIGNRRLMLENSIDIKLIEDDYNIFSTEGKTPIIIANDNVVVGLIAVRDSIKDSSISAIKRLKDMNIEVVMLTGDNKNTSKAIASLVGIDEVKAEVLPQDKYNYIDDLKSKGKIVCMVGDGINDSIALTHANIGVSLGAGSDIAIESANIILMKDDLTSLVDAINLSHKTINNIKQNLFFAFIYNVIGIFIACGVLYLFKGPLLNPMIGAIAMSFSSISVLLNTLRISKMKFKK